MGFLDNMFKDDKKKPPNNPLGNMFGPKNKFKGSGQSLGGSKPGTVISIIFPEAGPLGVRVEKRSNSSKTAIVHEVVAGGQAEKAGMLRGDILCFAGSNGQEEIMYDMFLEMAKSNQRPIELEVRRISTSLDKKKAPASTNGGKSADAEARRKAVIAAAEAREKAHKIKSKPLKQVTKSTLAKQQRELEQQQQEQRLHPSSQEPKSEASRMAAKVAKDQEAQAAAKLGYNPYAISRSTAGQARTATTAVQHGTMSADSAGDHMASVPSVAAPTNAMLAADEEVDGEIPFMFQQARVTLVSSTDDQAAITSSLNIIKKLLTNATTKGQQPGPDAAKFRKVRLANAKIKAAIVDVEGAVELMLSCGFLLEEQDGESVLVYPADTPGPDWLPAALKQLDASFVASTV